MMPEVDALSPGSSPAAAASRRPHPAFAAGRLRERFESGIALIDLFARKGLAAPGFYGALPAIDIGLHGPVGIVPSEGLSTFLRAVLILAIALGSTGALVSAAFSSASGSPSPDFGAPEVFGQNITILATGASLPATTAWKQLDREFETVSASLGVPLYRTLIRVTLPVRLPAIPEIGMFFFVNSMATVSAVIFLYSADLPPASVAVADMDDAGDTAPAAAMSVLIVAAAIAVRGLCTAATRRIRRRRGSWAAA